MSLGFLTFVTSGSMPRAFYEATGEIGLWNLAVRRNAAFTIMVVGAFDGTQG
jgi:hypothetical protein